MRIVQVTPRFPPAIGGMENHVYAVSAELQRRGHEVIVITSDDVDVGTSIRRGCSYTADGVKVYRYPLVFGKTMREYWFLSGVTTTLRSLQADVVHTNGYRCLCSCAATFWCKKNHIPTVLTAHGIYPARSLGNHLIKFVYDNSLGSLLLRFSSRITALTDHNRRLLLEMGAPADKIVFIPNGVNVGNYAEASRRYGKANKPEHQGPILLYVGRIDWNKGLENIVEAMPGLMREFSGIKLLMVGPDYGRNSQGLLDLAARLGVSDSVIVVGKVSEEEKLFYYSIADVFVLPARYEGLSLSLLEAMASKVPVVATRHGGPGDILVDHVHALLLDKCSSQEIQASVTALLKDSNLAERLSHNAFSKVLTQFSWGTVVDKLEALYNEICNIG